MLGKPWNFNTRPRQICRHFAGDIFKCIFFNENVLISLNFVSKVRINNISALVHTMAWCQSGDKPFSELMMASLLTHLCVTRPQSVKVFLFVWCICQSGFLNLTPLNTDILSLYLAEFIIRSVIAKVCLFTTIEAGAHTFRQENKHFQDKFQFNYSNIILFFFNCLFWWFILDPFPTYVWAVSANGRGCYICNRASRR